MLRFQRMQKFLLLEPLMAQKKNGKQLQILSTKQTIGLSPFAVRQIFLTVKAQLLSLNLLLHRIPLLSPSFKQIYRN